MRSTADPAIAPASGSPAERIAIALLALATLLQVAAFAWFVPGNDWARDLFMAAHIADTGEWPLRGAIVGSTAHLGPVWYWLLALPVALGAGFTGMFVFVGALAALKVPLAWRLGDRLGGRALALPFAALMLLPGWNLLTTLQLTYTALLETMLLASLLPLLTLWRGGGARGWLGFGALAGLALHAHPVALWLALPALVVAIRRRAGWRRELPMLALGVVLAALPLLPMLVAEWREGWPALAALGAADAGPRDASPVMQWFALLRATTIDLPAAVHVFVPASLHAAVVIAFVLLALLAASGLPALWRQPDTRRWWLVALVFWLSAAAWLVALRATVPFYMAALMTPLAMLLLALPLAAAATRPAMTALRRHGGVALALVLSVAANLGVMATMQSGHAALPLAAIHDIRSGTDARVPLGLMPAWAFDRAAMRACDSDALHVHGELAALVDFYQGMPFSWGCPPLALALGGTTSAPGRRHWAGTSPHTLRLLGQADAGWDAALAFAPRRIIAPRDALPLATAVAYPHRAGAITPVVTHRFEFAAEGDEAIAVFAPLFVFDGSRVLGARCNDVAVAPAMATNSGAIFLPPPACRDGGAWAIQVETRAPEQIDLVTLPLRPAGGRRDED